MYSYIGNNVFRLLKHKDELDIKTPTLLGEHNTYWGDMALCAIPPLVTSPPQGPHGRERTTPRLWLI